MLDRKLVDFTNENLAKLWSMENCEFSIAHLNHLTKWHISNVLYLNSVGKLEGQLIILFIVVPFNF
jgi:hypothetical protein